MSRPGLPGPPGERGERGPRGRQGEPFMTRGARYAVVFLFVLSFALAGGSYWLSTSAVHRATAAAVNTTQLCEAGNESRAQQVELWTRLVALSQPPPHQTPAQARKQAQTIHVFLAYVRHLFAPRNCARPLTTRRH